MYYTRAFGPIPHLNCSMPISQNITAAPAQPTPGAVVVGLGEMDDKERAAILAEFERKRRLRTLAVPTDDLMVRKALREMEEPITLFGEDKGLRRERLKKCTLKKLEVEAEAALKAPKKKKEEVVVEEKKPEVWYHEGPPELLATRLYIAKYSIP
ncbi:hypothetical protein SARC_15765, partial [Sphaeroforma arctica JP610]